MGLKKWLNDWREARILEIYKFVHEPIFEIQYSADDRYVHARSEEHRRRLIEAGNELFKQDLITVEEIYYKDVRFKFTESPEEYEERRQHFIEDYLNTWAKNLGEKNQKLVKTWLYNQELGEVTTKEATGESQQATGDFFTTQFPMCSRLLRGKELAK
jgi:Fic family protein